jgi:type IV secretion system protein VirD4
VDVRVWRPEEIRQLPERHALVVAENAPPLIARLTRCVDGKPGVALVQAQESARARVATARGRVAGLADRTARAVQASQRAGLDPVASPFRKRWEGTGW